MAGHLEDEFPWLGFSPIPPCQFESDIHIFDMLVRDHGMPSQSPLVDQRDETLSPNHNVYTPNSSNNESAHGRTDRTETAIERDFPLFKRTEFYVRTIHSNHSKSTITSIQSNKHLLERILSCSHNINMHKINFYHSNSYICNNRNGNKRLMVYYAPGPAYSMQYGMQPATHVHHFTSETSRIATTAWSLQPRDHRQQDTFYHDKRLQAHQKADQSQEKEVENCHPNCQSKQDNKLLTRGNMVRAGDVLFSATTYVSCMDVGAKLICEQCPPGPPDQPCTRCRKAYENGTLHSLPCDRSKLPDFLQDFLPETRLMEQVIKYSPPFGIKKLESSQSYFDNYMAELFQGGHHLQDFSEMYYASESRFETFSGGVAQISVAI
ncbi:hypothetical protein MRB53_037276 [Persea americana]|nr:hypothetical protein MRB53_037276 [Persea americana]